MMYFIKLALGLGVLMMFGDALLRCLEPDCRFGWSRPLLAFGIGHGVGMWLLWVCGMMGIGMWSWGIGLVVMFGFLGMLLSFSRILGEMRRLTNQVGRRGLRQNISGMILLGILGIAVYVVGSETYAIAMQSRVGCVSGLGNWLYKSKLLLMSEVWPSDFFEYEAHNRKVGYPPGFPLLAGWCAIFMGGLESHAIRLLPWVLVLGAFTLASGEMLKRHGWWGVAGVAGLMTLFLGFEGRGVLSHFYAEPLMLFQSAVVMVFLAKVVEEQRGIHGLFLSAGGLAWVKNEGIVVFLILIPLILFFEMRRGGSVRKYATSAAVIGAAIICMWRIYLFKHGWKDDSFASARFLGEGSLMRLGLAWQEYWEAMGKNGSRYGGGVVDVALSVMGELE